MIFNSPKIGIEAISYVLGERVVTNNQLQAENPSWDMTKTIERTGVASRRIALPGTTALDMAHEASVKVLKQLGITSSDVDSLIFCTQTPADISVNVLGQLGLKIQHALRQDF